MDARPMARRSLAILVLLLSINLLNYIDRQVLAATESSIQHDLFPSTQADVQFWMGLLPTAFLLSYMFTAPLFGWLADRMNRWWIISGGVIVWSLASGASGLATSYEMLLVTRLFIGVGEAAYGPAAPTVLADLYPIEKRGRVLSLFYVAIPVGSALGYLLGGAMADHFDWRYAFYLSMPPGVLLGLACLWLRDPRRDAPRAAAAQGHSLHDYTRLARTPSYVLNTLGMTAMTFALGALAFWMPRYVHDFRGASLPEELRPSLSQVTTIFGGITVVAGITATLFGGWLGDKLRARWPGSYFLVSGGGMLIGTPVFLLALITPFPAAWLLIFLAEFCLLLNTGPSNAILANVTPAPFRSSAFALNIFIIHVLGDAISPPLVGKISGLPGCDMNTGFAVISASIFLSGLFWLAGTPFLERDSLAAEADSG